MLVLMAKVDATPALPRESAQASLQYIRQTLEAAGRLSSVSGGGMIVVGCLALAAVEINQRLTAAPWDSGAGTAAIAVWGGLLLLSAAVTAFAMARKAKRTGQMFWSPVLRKALAIATAPMFLGALLSMSALRDGTLTRLLWGGTGFSRHNLRFTDAVDGHLFHAAGNRGAICAAIRGTGIAGSRFRRAAPGLRQLYLLEARWLNVTCHLRPASSTN